MKNATEAYIALEANATRLPVEIYKIWRGTDYFYYTSGDVTVTLDDDPTHPYVPAAIKRGAIQYNANLESSELEITFASVDDAISPYLASAPVNLAWIEIKKLFRDQSPFEAVMIFKGQIKSVALSGIAATAKCVGLEYLLQQEVPKPYFQAMCNWCLGDDNCGVDFEDPGVVVEAVVTVSADGKTLTASEFDAKTNGYFTLGSAEYGSSKIMIVDHVDADITLQRPIPGLETGMTVTAYPGCDGDVETCRDKFDNVAQFGGFPYIPLENPTTWIWK